MVEKKLHEYLINPLRHDIVPDFFSKGMLSTVRAVALAALAGSDVISINDLYRYLPSVPSMSLFGKAYFLLAALELEGLGEIIKDVLACHGVFTPLISLRDQVGQRIPKKVFSEEVTSIKESKEIGEPIRLHKSNNGLELAFDPRIPAEEQAFEFLIEGISMIGSVDWLIDGVNTAKTFGGRGTPGL